MSDVTIARGTVDDVRSIALRRKFDDAALGLALELADRGSTWVARDDGDVIGLAAISETEAERYAGDLYVEPSFRGQGIAGRLLEAAFAESDDIARAMAVDVADAASVALPLGRRLAVQSPMLRFAGAIPKEEELARIAAGDYRFEVGAIDPLRDAFGLDALDQECRGVTRTAEHRRFASMATGQTFYLSGEMVAYGYVWPDGRIGPLAVSSASYLVQLFAYALVTLQRVYRASWCTLVVPGCNVRVARAALRAGLRIEEVFVFARDCDPPNFNRYVGYQKMML